MEPDIEIYKRLLKTREDYIKAGEKRITEIKSKLDTANIEESHLKEHLYPNQVLIKKSREEIRKLDRELKHEQSLLDYHASEITNLLDKIREIEMGPNTLQSAPLIRMASQNPVHNESVKNSKSTIHPLQRLRAHGPFYHKFMKNIEGYAGVPGALHRKGVTLKHPYPSGGKTRKKYRK